MGSDCVGSCSLLVFLLCRRKVLLKPFTTLETTANYSGKELHDCCDICTMNCKCQCKYNTEMCECGKRCVNLDSKIFSHMNNHKYGVSDRTDSESSASDGSDFKGYIARKPQVLTYSSDED